MLKSLSFNNLLAQQLLAAIIAILAISSVLVVAMLAFRCYMLYCRTYDNTVTYQLPAYRPHSRQINLARKRRRLFFWRKNRDLNGANDRNDRSYNFQTIFEDPDIRDL
ncbi:hypothetical protein M3Y98_00299500 [Aphelenchoides besseyi]|nr:hypothetical protein M3Y98_00299500 [Aphelenchoides besseyi]KAI6201213.1 hypothetical protein M3Y96_00817800 [Aphelenchoides besseyi]